MAYICEGIKRCSGCGCIFKAELKYFHKKSTNTDGQQPECKWCRRKAENIRYDNNPLGIYLTVVKYRQLNPDSHNIHNKKYDYRKRLAEGDFTKDDISEMLSKQCGKCIYCGKDIRNCYTIDHIIPVSRGGSNHSHNLVLACLSCNSSKGNKTLKEWGREL